MIEYPHANNINSLLIDTLEEGGYMDGIKTGSVHHNRWICRLCKKGNKNTILHPYHYVQIYLPYLQSAPFRLSGENKKQSFKNGVDAYNFLERIQKDIENEKFIPWTYRIKSGSLCLFGNFFEKFKTHKYPGHKSYLKPLYPMDMKDIDRLTLKRFYEGMPHIKTSTRNLVMQIVRATLSEAVEEEIISSIPKFPKRDKAIKPVKNWLTQEEQLKVVEVSSLKYRLAILFLALHGKRVSEMESLEWENIDWKKRACRLYQSKILSEQWLPFHDLFWKELPDGAIHKTGRVFPQVSDDYYNKLLKKYCIKAGVPVVTSHEFSRHSFISQKQALGLSDELIAMVTDNLSSMKHYKHINLEKKRSVVNSSQS